jgi:hypothetical protein
MELHPQLRSQIEAAVGRSQAALQRGEGGDAVFELMQARMGRRGSGRPEGVYDRLELDKAWHGVHFVLSGTVEPGDSLVSQAVLGGTEIGDDFSGYGPARFFTAAQVAELASALAGAEPHFDPDRMNELEIYPFGWDEPDARDWIMTSFRELRDFYAAAAENGRAVVTCLV